MYRRASQVMNGAAGAGAAAAAARHVSQKTNSAARAGAGAGAATAETRRRRRSLNTRRFVSVKAVVVDDEEANRRILKNLLLKLKIPADNITLLPDGSDLVEYLSSADNRVDVGE